MDRLNFDNWPMRWGAVGAIILLAAWLRLFFLGAQSVAFDESFSLVVGSADWPFLFQGILSSGVHPPLFYVLHKITLAVLGNSEFGQRFLAAAFSLLGLPLIYQLGRRLFNSMVGLLALLLLALNPLHIWLAQDARMYSLFNTLVILSMLFFWEALRHNRRSNWIKLTLINALVFLVHYFGLLVPVIQLGYLILTFNVHYRRLRPWMFSQVGAGVFLLPWLIVVWLRPVQSFGIGFLLNPAVVDLPLTLWNLTTAINDFSWMAGVTTIFFGVAWLVALLFLRQPLTRRTRLYPQWLLACWGILPPVIVWLMSQRRSFYADRYLSFCIPALLLLAAYGVSRLPRSLWRQVIGIGLVLITFFGLVFASQEAAYQKDNWREAAAYVTAHQQPGDVILLRSLHIKFAFDYYYHGQAEAVPVTVNLEEYDPGQLVGGAKRAWLIFPYTRHPTHYPMQPLTEASVWDLDTTELRLLRRWFAAHQSHIIDSQRFLGVQVWLIKLDSS